MNNNLQALESTTTVLLTVKETDWMRIRHGYATLSLSSSEK
jgi:hypothetical protein